MKNYGTMTSREAAAWRIVTAHAKDEIDDDHAVYLCRMLAEGRLDPEVVMCMEPRDWEGAVK